MALFNIAAIVFIAGLLWQRDLRATLVIAAVIGLATRTLVALSVAIVAFATLGLVGGVVLAIDTHHWPAAPAVVPAIGRVLRFSWNLARARTRRSRSGRTAAMCVSTLSRRIRHRAGPGIAVNKPP